MDTAQLLVFVRMARPGFNTKEDHLQEGHRLFSWNDTDGESGQRFDFNTSIQGGIE